MAFIDQGEFEAMKTLSGWEAARYDEHQFRAKIKVLLLSQLLSAALFLQCPGNVAAQFTAAPPTCPGDTLIFTCNVTGDTSGDTLWRVDNSNILCDLGHLSAGGGATCGPGNAFTATRGTGFGETNATLFTSTLSATADPTLNGMLVECFGPDSSLNLGNRVGSSNIQIIGCVAAQFTAAPPTCPGDTLIFSCNVTGDTSGDTLWRVDNSNILCDLGHLSAGGTATCGPGDAFTAMRETGFGETNATLFTSTLSATADSILNGMLVKCFGPDSSIASGNMVGSSNIQIIAPPAAAPGTPSVRFSMPREQFNITWDEPTLSMGETVDTYFVNISGPNDLCGNGNILPRVTEPSYTCSIQTAPQEGETYTIRVATVTCNGSLRGPESNSRRLQVPDAPTVTFQPDCPGLSFVDIVWQNNSVAAPQITEVCVSYCTEGNCTSECSDDNPFRINNVTTGSIYNVSVSLRNDFGESGQTTALYVNDEGQCVTPTPTPTPVPPTTSSETPTQPPTQTQPPTTTGSSSPAGASAGAIAGGVIGGLIGAVLIILIIVVIVFLVWRTKNSPRHKEEDMKPNRWSKKRHSSEAAPNTQELQVDPAYEEVDTLQSQTIRLEENVAYGPVKQSQKIELKENVAYGPVKRN